MSALALEQDIVDVDFQLFGTAAAYVPPGGGLAIPCAIIRAVPDRTLGFGQGAPLMQSDQVELRKSEIVAPAKGGTFTLSDGGEVLTILSDPRCEDPLALVWIMTVG